MPRASASVKGSVRLALLKLTAMAELWSLRGLSWREQPVPCVNLPANDLPDRRGSASPGRNAFLWNQALTRTVCSVASDARRFKSGWGTMTS